MFQCLLNLKIILSFLWTWFCCLLSLLVLFEKFLISSTSKKVATPPQIYCWISWKAWSITHVAIPWIITHSSFATLWKASFVIYLFVSFFLFFNAKQHILMNNNSVFWNRLTISFNSKQCNYITLWTCGFVDQTSEW